MFKNCYFYLRSLVDFNGFFKTTASYLNKSATNNLHCFRNLRSKGFRTKSKKQDLVFSVKLQNLGLEKSPKKWLSENVQILWGSKTSNNGSKMAVFETKIQTKKQYSPKAVEQKDLYFHGLYQKI